MSLVSVQIRPVSGSNLDINTTDGSGNHLFPLHEFEPEIDLPDVEFKRMQATGVWPVFAYPGAMTIIATGEVLGIGGSDSARSSDAMTKRASLMDACLPPVDSVLTARKHGTLRVQYDHWAETADADFQCILCKIPIKAQSPARMQYFINFKCFTPYFVGTGTQTKYLP
jgi:hypothetical protein